MSRSVRLIFGLCVVTARPGPAPAQLRFVEVGADRGLQAYQMTPGMGGGAAAADFDNDGYIDLFVPNDFGYPDQLYHNLAGQYVEIGGDAGVASLAANRSALWFDYDGDHDLDLLVAGDCWHATCREPTTLRLYRQYARARFEDRLSLLLAEEKQHSGPKNW